MILLQEAIPRCIGVIPMPGLPRIIKILLPVPLLLAGCTSLWQATMGGLSETSSGAMRRGVSSSLVEYLYPSGEEPPPFNDSVPQLNIPLRVGLAFVPSTDQAMRPCLAKQANQICCKASEASSLTVTTLARSRLFLKPICEPGRVLRASNKSAGSTISMSWRWFPTIRL